MYSALSRSQRGGGGFPSKPPKHPKPPKPRTNKNYVSDEEGEKVTNAQAALEEARGAVPEPRVGDGRSVDDMIASIRRMRAAQKALANAEQKAKYNDASYSTRRKKGGRRRYTLRKRKGIRR